MLQFKMAQIFLDDGRHRHAKTRREILHCHRLLLSRIGQETNQAARQIFRISGSIKFNRQLFSVSHLTEIGKVRGDDGNPIGAGKMRNAAATRRRGVGHNRNRGTLEKIRQIILVYVTSELDCGIARALFPDGFDITRGLRMVSAGDDQLGVRQDASYGLECVEHEFEALVGSPLAKRQYAMLRIAAPGEVRVLGSSGQHSVGPDMNIVMPIFFVENPAIAGHKY